MRVTMITALGQYDSLEEYCGLSTASVVFLLFTTQLPIHVFAAIFSFNGKREVLQKEFSRPTILPSLTSCEY